jgi:hypothetical protein
MLATPAPDTPEFLLLLLRQAEATMAGFHALTEQVKDRAVEVRSGRAGANIAKATVWVTCGPLKRVERITKKVSLVTCLHVYLCIHFY